MLNIEMDIALKQALAVTSVADKNRKPRVLR